MLCSFLIPSRNRTEGLCRAIDSVLAISEGLSEILVRLDQCDPSLERTKEELFERKIKFLIGNRLWGYQSVGTFLRELNELASGSWVSMLDDDCTLEGDGWTKALGSFPLHRSFAFARTYHYATSFYRQEPSAKSSFVAGWFLPRNSWLEFGENFFAPVDAWAWNLARRYQLSIHPLEMLTYHHCRAEVADLEIHRKITDPFFASTSPHDL